MTEMPLIRKSCLLSLRVRKDDVHGFETANGRCHVLGLRARIPTTKGRSTDTVLRD